MGQALTPESQQAKTNLNDARKNIQSRWELAIRNSMLQTSQAGAGGVGCLF